MIELHGEIKDDQFWLPRPLAEYRRRHLKKYNGRKAVEIIKLEVNPKTHSQVKNHFGNALQRIVDECEHRGYDSSMLYNMEIPTGVPIDFDQLQQYFYAHYPTYNDDGVLITMSHDDYTTVHASRFFESIRNHAASQWGIIIPDPNPNWRKEA